jgi:PAP2 superfamily
MQNGFQLNPTFSFTLLGTLAIYLWSQPPRWAWIWLLPVAAILRTASWKMTGGFGTYFGAEWISWGTFLGLASLMVVAVEAIRTPKKQREVFTRMFYAGAVFPLLAMVVGYSIPLNLWLRPKTYDAFLLGFDRSLGFQPSFWLGRVVLGSYRIWGWTTVIYYALPFSGALLYASHRIRLRQPVAVLWLLLSFIIVGFAQYGVYPAVGPVHAFPALYPWKENLAAQIALQPLVVGADPRNCMPSLHLGAALLVWWNSRVWPVWGRICAGLFFLGTVFSTLSLGEHYLIDLVVAFPYALAFQAAWTTAVPLGSPRRITPLVAGFGMTAAWCLLLRYAIPGFLSSAVLSWVSIVATVWWSSSMKRNLDAAAQVVAISELTQASEATISF